MVKRSILELLSNWNIPVFHRKPKIPVNLCWNMWYKAFPQSGELKQLEKEWREVIERMEEEKMNKRRKRHRLFGESAIFSQPKSHFVF